jgi:broad specificity phosphatase PhoE
VSTLYVARHGETDWNARGKLQGHTDIPLNEAGKAQARALAERLRGLGLGSVTTSDLSRANETGAIVAETLSLVAPAVDHELRERCFGVFEGLTREECAAQHPEAWRAWVEQTSPPEGAEAVALAVERLTRAFDRIVARGASQPTLVVSHGGVMRLWMQSVLGTTLPLIANGSVYAVDVDAGEPRRFRVERWER